MTVLRRISRFYSAGRALYFDLQATTPVDPRVLDAMLPYFTKHYGNPHSRTHSYGWDSKHAVENARKAVSGLIGVSNPRDVIFTSGATESNNIAIKGVAKFYKLAKKDHIITSKIEHKSVLNSFRSLEGQGFSVTYLPVDANGLVSAEDLRSAITPQTSMVSIMAINNEIGTIQNISEIGSICRQYGVVFHTDAAQAVGKIRIDVEKMNIDLLSVSGHKFYGPKGVGALYVRRKNPHIRLLNTIDGGGQERGLRSGTLPTPLAVGLGKACELAQEEMEYDSKRIERLSQMFARGIIANLEAVSRNGGDVATYPGCVNMSFSCVEGESLIMYLKGVAVSSGSACTSESLEPSYVLRSLGTDEDMAHSSIRFGIGKFTTEKDIKLCIKKVVSGVRKLRKISPLWEMLCEGVDLKKIEWQGH